jgi:hypothetical protein
MAARNNDRISELAPEVRRQLVAEILSAGVARWRRAALMRPEQSSQSRRTNLEVSPETRLSVTVGFETDSETTNAR